jgi:UDP-N-acetyl-D-mannosaminuronate dehydrogenase
LSNPTSAKLIVKLQSKNAIIGVVGMGYVGQPLALRYSKIGFRVLGFDIDQEKVAQLNRGQSSIEHISKGFRLLKTSDGLPKLTPSSYVFQHP